MEKFKDIVKPIILAVLILFILIFIIISSTYLISRYETPESSIIHKKNISLKSNDKYEHTFTNVRAGRLLSWKWEINDFDNNTIKFYLENKEKNKIYYFSSNQNQTFDEGEFISEYRDDYTFIWKNANSTHPINITINKLILWDSEGIEEPMFIIYILIPILILSYIIYYKKYSIRSEDRKEPLKKYKKIVLIIILSIVIWLILSNIFFSGRVPVENRHVNLNSFEIHKQKYPELLSDLSVPIKWNIDGNTSINFWIEDKNGFKYKQLNASENIISQNFRFVPPKDGDYWLYFENPTNNAINLYYKYDPNPKDNTFKFVGVFAGIICAILIYMNIYLIMKNKRIKKEVVKKV